MVDLARFLLHADVAARAPALRFGVLGSECSCLKFLWRILPRDVRTFFLPTNGLFIQPLQVQLFAGEQKATEASRGRRPKQVALTNPWVRQDIFFGVVIVPRNIGWDRRSLRFEQLEAQHLITHFRSSWTIDLLCLDRFTWLLLGNI